MRQAARALGCSTGALYHFFPSKEALFRDCVRHVAEQQMSQASEVAAQHEDAREQLTALGAQLLSDRPGHERLLLLIVAAVQSQRRKLRTEVISEVLEEYVRALSEILKRGNKQGSLSVRDPVAAARLFVAAMDGLALQSHAAGVRLDAKTTDQAVALLMRAFEPPRK